ncbi:oligosaccharide flippase family protein, partial [Lactobacillus jensenii]
MFLVVKRKKSLGFNGLLNGVRSALNLVFPLITFPYITRVLSVGSVGAYNFSNTYVGYFILLAGLGISTYAVREGAKYRDNREKLSKFASEIFAINLWSTVVSYVLLFMSLLIFRNLQTYLLFILIFSVQIFFTTVGIEWIYIINEDYSYIT